MNKSTVSNLTTYQPAILQDMEDRKQTDSVYADISIAFDPVDHMILNKLLLISFHVNFVLWSKNSFSTRIQRGKVGCYYSNTIKVISAIPQGAIDHYFHLTFLWRTLLIFSWITGSSCLLMILSFREKLKVFRIYSFHRKI